MIGLFKSTERRAIAEIDLRKFQRPQRIASAADVEFRAMIGERQQVLVQECLEPRSRGFQM